MKRAVLETLRTAAASVPKASDRILFAHLFGSALCEHGMAWSTDCLEMPEKCRATPCYAMPCHAGYAGCNLEHGSHSTWANGTILLLAVNSLHFRCKFPISFSFQLQLNLDYNYTPSHQRLSQQI